MNNLTDFGQNSSSLNKKSTTLIVSNLHTENNLPNKNFLKESHKREFEASAIAEDIYQINFRSLSEKNALESLLGHLPITERKNTGVPRDVWFRKYSHLKNGAWGVKGLELSISEDGIDFVESDYELIKPNTPRGYLKDSKQKQIKYESPPKIPLKLIFLKVPRERAIAIFEKNGLSHNFQERYSYSLFWEAVANNPKIPLTVVEGEKKAACLLSHNIVSIPLRGLNSGYKTVRDEYGSLTGSRELISELQIFNHPNREFTLAFDQDLKLSTKKAVSSAIKTLKGLLDSKKIFVYKWDTPDKGIDDFLSKNSIEKLQKVDWASFSTAYLYEFSGQNKVINCQYVDFEIIPRESNLVFIKSDMGTGKTFGLSNWSKLRESQKNGTKTFILVHRNLLASNLANTLGVGFIWDKNDLNDCFGKALCIDSLLKIPVEQFDGANIILDEVDQVFDHILNSSTLKDNRVTILKRLKEAINLSVSGGGTIVSMSANLDNLDRKFIKNLIEDKENINEYVLENTYKVAKEKKRNCRVYEETSPLTLFNDLIGQIKAGKKVFIFTDSQKPKKGSLLSTYNLFTKLSDLFPNKKILRIDSKTTDNPNQEANKFYNNLQRLKNYDIIISSPSLETGVSIKFDSNHFDLIVGISGGTVRVNSLIQALERVREDCDRWIWVNKFSRQRVGSGSISPYVLLSEKSKDSKKARDLLTQIGFIDEEFSEIDTTFLNQWSWRSGKLNYESQKFRELVIKRLAEKGYSIIKNDNQLDEGELEKIKVDLLGNTVTNQNKWDSDRIEAALISEEKYEKLSKKLTKNDQEFLEVEKKEIVNKWGDISCETLELDNKNRYQKMRNLYFYLKDREASEEYDLEKYLAYSEKNNGEVYSPDIPRSMAEKIQLLDLLNIKQFFDRTKTFTKKSLEDWANTIRKIWTRLIEVKTKFGKYQKAEKASFLWEIRKRFGVSISKTALEGNNIRLAQELLALVNLKLEYIGRIGDRENRQRVYRGIEVPQDWNKIFAYWDHQASLRREKMEENLNKVWSADTKK